MCAEWSGARYFRQKDHQWVDRDDLDKRSKKRSVHRVYRTPKAKKPSGKYVITRGRLR